VFAQLGHFDEHAYQRVLIASREGWSLLLLCWSRGQATPVHTHGGAAAVWIKVIQGRLSQQLIGDDGVSFETSIAAGSDIVFMGPNVGRHRLANIAGATCARSMSLHLYAPPYFEQPFDHDMTGRVATLPVIYRPLVPTADSFADGGTRRIRARMSLQGGSTESSADEDDSSDASGTASTSSALAESAPIYTSFDELVDLLRAELRKEPADARTSETIERVSGALASFRFHPKEWRRYTLVDSTHYTRNLVGYDDKFTMLILVWDSGQISPIHDHAGASCWMKVLAGEMREDKYRDGENGLDLYKTTTLTAEDAAYIDDSWGYHKFGNARTDSIAVSLHIYSPPYSQCHVLEEATGAKEMVTIGKSYNVANPFVASRLSKSRSWRSFAEVDELRLEPVGASAPTTSASSATLAELSKIDRPPVTVAELIQRLSELAADTSGSTDGSSQQLYSFGSEHGAHAAALLTSAKFADHEWRQYVHFSGSRYQRVLLAFNENFSLVLCCWTGAQQTPRHRHGPGKQAWVRVLCGSAFLTRYTDDVAGDVLSRTVMATDDGVSYLDPEKLGLHVLGNKSDEAELVTLHLYSPPLVDLSFADPERPGTTSTLPVIFCAKSSSTVEAGVPTVVPESSLSSGTKIISRAKRLLARSVDEDSEVFASVHQFVAALHTAFASESQQSASKRRRTGVGEHVGSGPTVEDMVMRIMSAAELHPQEIETYAHFVPGKLVRRLIATLGTCSLWLWCVSAGAPAAVIAPCKCKQRKQHWLKVVGPGSVRVTGTCDAVPALTNKPHRLCEKRVLHVPATPEEPLVVDEATERVYLLKVESPGEPAECSCEACA